MKLNLSERSAALNLLPERGNVVTLRTVDQARHQLALSPEEFSTWDVKEDKANNRVMWNPEIDTTTEVDLSTEAIKMISDRLRELDQEATLEMSQMSLWEKFVAGQNGEATEIPSHSMRD